jgi:Tfp pilus assembly protein PilW
VKVLRFCSGFGLPSLLVGLAIGAGLLLTAGEVIVMARETARWQAAAVDLERAGQRALDILASEVRAAGFRGGVGFAPVVPAGPGCGADDGWALQLSPPLLFADRGTVDNVVLSDGSNPACLPLAALQAGSDLLAVRRTAQLASGDTLAAPARRLRDTQWYLAAGEAEEGAFIYRDTDFGAAVITADSVLWEWRTGIYFVRGYSVSRSDRLPALCVERLAGAGMRSECLVEGVVRLHAEFLIDTESGEPVSHPSPTPEQLARARYLTLYLHVRSVEALRPSRQERILALGSETVPVPAGDPYLHRVFVRTVPLDNAGFAAGFQA